MNLIINLIITLNIFFFYMKEYNPVFFFKTIYSPEYILEYGEYSRMFTHVFSHLDLRHLFVNMISFYQISEHPLNYNFNYVNFLLLYFAIYNFLYLSISYSMLIFFSYSELFYAKSVGFSGVVFCLKYLTNLYNGNTVVNLFGMFNVYKKYVVFFELFLTSYLLSNVSFSGHLFGILTGMIMHQFNLVPIQF